MKMKMKTKMLSLMALLLMSLSLTACLGGKGGFLAAGANDSAAATKIAAQFLDACLVGDTATALDSLTANVRQAVALTGGYPCSSVSPEAADAVYLSTETVGQTTTVTYSWRRSSGETVNYRMLVREEAGDWLIFDVHQEYVQPTRLPRPEPALPPYTIPRP